jgi:hypothetical protein
MKLTKEIVMVPEKILEIERLKFEVFLFQFELNKINKVHDKKVIFRRWKLEELDESERDSVDQYFDPATEEKWQFWLASALSKYDDYVLMPKEPNCEILSEIELHDGWSQLALTTRYKAMLTVGQRFFQ